MFGFYGAYQVKIDFNWLYATMNGSKTGLELIKDTMDNKAYL